jgi:hypothetical protein
MRTQAQKLKAIETLAKLIKHFQKKRKAIYLAYKQYERRNNN